MGERYQSCKAVIFSEGKIVPFWKCRFSPQKNTLDEFDFEDESSSNVIETVWDCKKNKLVDPFIIEKRESKLPCGIPVAVERNGKIYLDKIIDVEFNDFEDYYAKYDSEKDSARLSGINIPEETKVIIYRHYRPTYIFESGLPSVHELYVKEFVEKTRTS